MKFKEINKKLIINNEKGITLTSLVVTIIILLILAGITIKFALDDNGIIAQTRLASEKYKNSTQQEQTAINQIAKEMQSSGSASGGGSSGGGSGQGGSVPDDYDEIKQENEELKKENEKLKNTKAEGNATPEQVLSDATFSSSTLNGATGTMKNNGAWISNSSGAGQLKIPQGYHNGNGYVDLSGSYNGGYSQGVADADSRVNKDSESYKKGLSNGLLSFVGGEVVTQTVCSGAGGSAAVHNSWCPLWTENTFNYNQNFTVPKMYNGGVLYAIEVALSYGGSQAYGQEYSGSGKYVVYDSDGSTMETLSVTADGEHSLNRTVDFAAKPYSETGDNITFHVDASGRARYVKSATDGQARAWVTISATAKYKLPKR